MGHVIRQQRGEGLRNGRGWVPELVNRDVAVPIDWDLPEVGDPTMEIALLDKHASLFNRHELPPGVLQGLWPEGGAAHHSAPDRGNRRVGGQ
jgi:hypothetical protein